MASDPALHVAGRRLFKGGAHEAGHASAKFWWKVGSDGLPRGANERLVGLPFIFDVDNKHFGADVLDEIIHQSEFDQLGWSGTEVQFWTNQSMELGRGSKNGTQIVAGHGV